MAPTPQSLALRLAALALFALLLAGFGIGVVAPLVHEYRATLAGLEADLQGVRRDQRIARREAVLRRSIEALGGGPADALPWLPPGSDAAAVAALRERLQQALNCTGVQPAGMQPLPAATTDGFRRVGLRLRFAATIDGLRRVLHALESGRPSLVLDNLSIRAAERSDADPAVPLEARIDVLAFQPGDA
jgi:general secretion pathway protein M